MTIWKSAFVSRLREPLQMSSQSNDSQDSAGPQTSRPESPGSGPASVVLVVEDDAWIRKAVGRKLQAAGFEVILVPTAADALIVAQRTAFQVLVLDLHLPDNSDPFHGISDGFAMLDWLRRQVGGFRFSIVVHTSQRSEHVLQKAQEHGVFAVCHKQRDLTSLLQYVTQAIESMTVVP